MVNTWFDFGAVLMKTVIFGKFSFKISDVFFQGQTLFWTYLRNGWSDWFETKRKCIGLILGIICGIDLWPHSWHWPWIFKVKCRNSCISGIVGLIDVKWKGRELTWYWTDCMIFAPSPHPWPWALSFKVRFWNCYISGMGWPVDMER